MEFHTSVPLPCATDDGICIATETLFIGKFNIVTNGVQKFAPQCRYNTSSTKSTNNNTYACTHTDTNTCMQLNTHKKTCTHQPPGDSSLIIFLASSCILGKPFAAMATLQYTLRVTTVACFCKCSNRIYFASWKEVGVHEGCVFDVSPCHIRMSVHMFVMHATCMRLSLSLSLSVCVCVCVCVHVNTYVCVCTVLISNLGSWAVFLLMRVRDTVLP